MELKILTLAERNTYSGANGLAFMVAIMAVFTLAASGGNRDLVLLVAALSGLWLSAWSRLAYSLIESADRWIAPLVSLAVLCCLLAALAESWLTLLGAATLLFVCWLPYMVAESAGQALRVWAYLSASPHARRMSQVAQSAIDVAAIGGTAVLLAIASGDGRPGVGLTAAARHDRPTSGQPHHGPGPAALRPGRPTCRGRRTRLSGPRPQQDAAPGPSSAAANSGS